MTGAQPAHEDEAVSQWLAERHRDLVSDLRGTLDLNAGLREIAIAADHHALVSDLSDLLDLDAGLAAILPAPEDLAYPAAPESPSGHSSLGASSTDLVNAIAASPAAVRLALRASALNLAQAVDIVGTLDRVKEWVGILMTDLASASAQAIVRARALDLAHARALAHALDLAHARDLDLALVLALARALDLAHALDRAHDLAHARDLDLALARALARAHRLTRAHAHDLAHTLGIAEMEMDQVENLDTQQLRNVVNDLTGADLHDVDLETAQLDGVRWSNATRWPTQWIDRIRRDSVDLGDGIYEYRPGNSTVDDDLTLALR
jgi:hypothetical protein